MNNKGDSNRMFSLPRKRKFDSIFHSHSGVTCSFSEGKPSKEDTPPVSPKTLHKKLIFFQKQSNRHVSSPSLPHEFSSSSSSFPMVSKSLSPCSSKWIRHRELSSRFRQEMFSDDFQLPSEAIMFMKSHNYETSNSVPQDNDDFMED